MVNDTWIGANRVPYRVKVMSTRHIRACVRMLERRQAAIKSAEKLGISDIDTGRDDAAWLVTFQEELVRRDSLSRIIIQSIFNQRSKP